MYICINKIYKYINGIYRIFETECYLYTIAIYK